MGTAVNPAFRQTSQAAIAIAIYKIVQTGPNSQLGGVQLGLLKLAYQGRSAGMVHNDPSPPAPRHTRMQRVSLMVSSHAVILMERAVFQLGSRNLVKLVHERWLFTKNAAQCYGRHLSLMAFHAAHGNAIVLSCGSGNAA